jgi:hypothetical protein
MELTFFTDFSHSASHSACASQREDFSGTLPDGGSGARFERPKF